ncbi:hypothetical protein HRI_004847200 [Hibiscus trionum]|uniref:Uncharacterized protein n=1 Tax=Hibiscus trionum TaxID=183268 RepID=A0A9W7JC20_HIBTR|nr:hypothetical protein HRI_004847200 [Hibiscus trionum]
MFACLKGKRHENNQTFFRKNGGALLEELVAFCDGRSNPIRHFSAEELLRATNYYDTNRTIARHADYILYRGSIKEGPILVKKYGIECSDLCEHFAYRDIVIGSQMSAHKSQECFEGYRMLLGDRKTKYSFRIHRQTIPLRTYLYNKCRVSTSMEMQVENCSRFSKCCDISSHRILQTGYPP